jgi:putative DNA primase/helicase
VPDRVWDDNPELRAAAEAERERHRTAHLEVADARPPEYSDEALALRFSSKHADDVRYVASWGKWALWNGAAWFADQTLRAFDLSRAVCRVASAEIDDPKQVKLAAQVASAKTVAAVVSLARADRRHAATSEQWDANAWDFHTKGQQNDS